MHAALTLTFAEKNLTYEATIQNIDSFRNSVGSAIRRYK